MQHFYGKWFECAAGSKIIDSVVYQDVPPTRGSIQNWIDNVLMKDDEVKNDVYHRYILTGAHYKNMISWLTNSFKMRNATEAQIKQINTIVLAYFHTIP